MQILKLTARVGVYSVGMFILALGVALSINADLGISPVSSWAIAVHMASGIGAGLSKSLFFVLCILVQIAILRKNFRWIDLTQIIFSFMFGLFLDAAIWIIGDLASPSYAGQLVMLGISIVLISTGLAVYLAARLVSLPAEGIIDALMKKYPKLTFQKIKVTKDSILVLLAIATTLIFMGGIYGVREGTVLSALLVGRLAPPIRRVVDKALKPAALFENSAA